MGLSDEVDAVVIGAGVVGLACAYELSRRLRSVVVVERDVGPARETSSRNSGVIHAGIYYPADSFKTKLCIEGKRRLYDWCESHDVPHRRTGKLIVATNAEEERRLRAIARHSKRVGVDDLRTVSRDALRTTEPEVRCTEALFSPSSGIVDVHGLAESLVREIREADGTVVYQTTIESIARARQGWMIETRDTLGRRAAVHARRVVNAAGLSALRVAEASGLSAAERPWRLHLCKGSYFVLGAGAPPTRHSLIYPLPEAGGLGIHLTADLSGARRAGPDIQLVDHLDYAIDETRAHDFARAVARYLPAIRAEHLTPDYSGIRPKLVRPEEGFADFVIASPPSQPQMVHLIGIESPGLTASLAIGAHVADQIT